VRVVAALGLALAGCGGSGDGGVGGGSAAPVALGIASSYDVSFDQSYDYASLAAEGVRRVNVYYLWKDFEAPDGSIPVDTFADVDALLARVKAAGMLAVAVVAITDTDCQENDTDACWLGYGVPDDLATSFQGFDAEPFLTRVRALARAFAEHFDGSVLSHVLIGNETNSFLNTRPRFREGLPKMMAAIQEEIADVSPRPKFGTILGFDADAPDDWRSDLARATSEAAELASYTLYPSLEPSFKDVVVEPSAELVAKWFGRAEAVSNGRPIVVSETGFHVCGSTGSEERQTRYAEEVIAYLRAHGARYDYATWWSYWDSPKAPYDFARCTGLKTFEGAPRPAHGLWMAAAR
jgi:hypothetical protein